MRMLVTVHIPHEPFNEAVRDGSAGPKTEAILNELKPEAVYFTEMEGLRTVIMIVEIDSPSMVPAIAEPWFLTFSADVEFHIVMGRDDLKKSGLDKLGEKWG